MKKFQCENCGAAMNVNEGELTVTCEYCGTTFSLPNPKSEYSAEEVNKLPDQNDVPGMESKLSKKKVNLFLATIFIIFAVAIFIVVSVFITISKQATGMGGMKPETAGYSWPVTGLAAMLPEPSGEYGEIMSNSDSHFSTIIYNASQDDFDTYVAECREEGFTLASEGSSSSYTAYNTEGYCIDVFYWAEYGELSIYLDEPEKMTELNWPTTGMAAELPKPDAEYGRIISDDSDEVYILVYLDSKTEFDTYVEECKKYGFTENHEFYFSDYESGWYEADHKNGHHLDVSYTDSYYKKMDIRIEVEK